MCTYTARDGHVNPDVRTLEDPGYANNLPAMAISNAIAYVLTRSSDYSSVAASYIDTFFLDQATAMSPALDYGQIVRGPGKTEGSFMAIIDWRGMVKIANAVQILRQARAPEWTAKRDQAFVSWARQYLHWLQTSTLGQKASRAAKCVAWPAVRCADLDTAIMAPSTSRRSSRCRSSRATTPRPARASDNSSPAPFSIRSVAAAISPLRPYALGPGTTATSTSRG